MPADSSLIHDQPTVRTLVQYVEVWVPSEDGQTLQLQAATVIAEAPDRDRSGSTVVASGEGIAGRAWNQRRATVLQEAPSELLGQLSSQCGTELKAVLAIPAFCEAEIRGVVVLGLGSGSGAVEVWSRDDRDELSVSASFYSGLPTFEFISRFVRFPRGAGVPGAVWKTGLPKLAASLGFNHNFMRTFDTDPAQLTTGLGIPVGCSAGLPDSVLLLLSAADTPIARQCELWRPVFQPAADPAAEPLLKLELMAADSAGSKRQSAPVADELVIQTARTGLVALQSDDLQASNETAVSVVLPIYRARTLVSVLKLVF